MSRNSRLKATNFIGQGKAFYRQRIPESSCVRKKSVDLDILLISRNVDRKIMQSIWITSKPPSRQKQPPEVFCKKRCSLKFRKIHRKTPVPESLFKLSCNFFKKEILAKVFSCEFCEISKNNFFTEHLRTTASVIKTNILYSMNLNTKIFQILIMYWSSIDQNIE